MLLARRCPLCDRPGRGPCAGCAAGLPAPSGMPVPAGLASLTTLFAYDASGRRVVLAAKYHHRRDALEWAAAELARAVPRIDVITWPPTRADRRADRGYDQAEVLARGIGAASRVPVRRLLARAGGWAQTGRSATERRVGPDFEPRRVLSGRVLVVDDVATTGSTLAAAGAALRVAGAGEVHGATMAWTPPPTRGRPRRRVRPPFLATWADREFS